MANDDRKLANACYESSTQLTSADFKHGFRNRPVPKFLRKLKRYVNRATRREIKRRDIQEQIP